MTGAAFEPSRSPAVLHWSVESTAANFAAAMTLVAVAFAKLALPEILLARQVFHRSIFDLDPAKLGFYFLNPIGLIVIAVGMGAAYRTANGSVTG